LTVAKAGVKMHTAEPGTPKLGTNNGLMTAEKASVAYLARSLSNRLGAPVVDATGLTAVFDFRAELPPRADRVAPSNGDAPGTDASDPASSAAALSHALEDQLGLKLEARKVPEEVLVIDRAEKPVEN
jgi:uncharacterized protein (TIGR03435 family)